MAHFAQTNENNIVVNVAVINNDVIRDANGNEQEQLGKDFLVSLHPDTTWVQASYNGSFRKQYPMIGAKYDSTKDIFINPSPFSSWILNSNNDWESPTPKPNDGKEYDWVESSTTWVLVSVLTGEITDEFAD
jgi:hypothetical protein